MSAHLEAQWSLDAGRERAPGHARPATNHTDSKRGPNAAQLSEKPRRARSPSSLASTYCWHRSITFFLGGPMRRRLEAGQAVPDPRAVPTTGTLTKKTRTRSAARSTRVKYSASLFSVRSSHQGPAACTIDMGTSHKAGNMIPRPLARNSAGQSRPRRSRDTVSASKRVSSGRP